MYGYMSIVMLLLVATCATLSLGHASERLGGERPGVIIEHIDTSDAVPALLERFPQLTDQRVYIAEASQLSQQRKSDLEARRLEMDHEFRMQALIGDQEAKKSADNIRILELENEKSRLELYDNALVTVKMVVGIGGVAVAAIFGGPPLLAAVRANSAAIVEIIAAAGAAAAKCDRSPDYM